MVDGPSSVLKPGVLLLQLLKLLLQSVHLPLQLADAPRGAHLANKTDQPGHQGTGRSRPDHHDDEGRLDLPADEMDRDGLGVLHRENGHT